MLVPVVEDGSFVEFQVLGRVVKSRKSGQQGNVKSQSARREEKESRGVGSGNEV